MTNRFAFSGLKARNAGLSKHALLGALLLGSTLQTSAQAPFWLLSTTPASGTAYQDIVRFNDGGANRTQILNRQIAGCGGTYTDYVANAWFRGNGSVAAWFDYQGRARGYDASGCLLAGPLVGFNGYSSSTGDIVLAPATAFGTNTNQCGNFVGIAYASNATPGVYGQLQYITVAPNGFPSNPAVPFFNTDGPFEAMEGTSDPTIPFASNTAWGRVAVANPTAAGKQFVYLAVEGGGIWQYELWQVGNGVRLSTRLDATNTPVSRNTANIITPVFGGGTYRTNELEVSDDGSRIAWADANGDKVYMAQLNPTTGNVITPVVVEQATVSGLSINRINGLEFAPGRNDVLYVTAGADNQSTDGVFKVTRTGSNTFSVARLTNVGALSTKVANSYIEADVNGNLQVLSSTQLITVVPTAPGAPSPGTLQGTPVNHTYPTMGGVPSGARRLPQQVGGWHYNFGGYLTGARIVPIAGSTPAPIQTYTARPLPTGTTYTFQVRRNGNVIPGSVQTSTSNTYTFNFSGYSTSDSYAVEVTATRNTTCAEVSSGSMNVTLTSSGLPQRPGNASPLVSPNPATGAVRLDFGGEGSAERSVTVQDAQGKVRFTQRVPAATATTTLDLAALPAGIYLVRVQDGASTRTERLLLTREW